MLILAGDKQNEKGEYDNVEWTWDNSDYLIQATIGEDSVLQISYEDLIVLSAGIEKVKFDRLKEEQLKRT